MLGREGDREVCVGMEEKGREGCARCGVECGWCLWEDGGGSVCVC